MRQGISWAVAALLVLTQCKSGDVSDATGSTGGTAGTAGQAGAAGSAPSDVIELPAETQRTGDPTKGYWALVNENYVSCGVPWTAYSKVFAPPPESEKLPGRDGKNADMPYNQTVIMTPSGVEAVSPNCLTCHAGHLNGKVVIGLGAADMDFTIDQVSSASLAKFLLSDPNDLKELDRFIARTKVVQPYTLTATVGVNPADNLAAILFAHRDGKTFEWHDPPLLEPPPQIVVPVDVPPWWRMKKKTALFYVAAGRGDHARTLMGASTLCTDNIDEARHIDTCMPDIYSYLKTLEAPKYPYPIDNALADTGKQVFSTNCAQCHGSYGPDGKYTTLLVKLPKIQTDSTLALGASQFAERFLNWFETSFYGEVSRLEPQEGYVAPPLDGIWATAPFLHNGSVPTIEALLDSSKRPKFWTRTFDSSDYDPATLGWHFTTVDHGQADETDPKQKKLIYDTTLLGYGNGGHTFGDTLSADQRKAVIEYLKTL